MTAMSDLEAVRELVRSMPEKYGDYEGRELELLQVLWGAKRAARSAAKRARLPVCK
jgi:hypothetical protein